MVIAFANQKGGVGKSSLAVHYAVYERMNGRSVAVVDLDRQRDAHDWIRKARPEIEASCILPPALKARIGEAARKRRRLTVIENQESFDTVVIDAPGDLEHAKLAFVVADLVVLPCLPSDRDVASTVTTLSRIADARRVRKGLPLPVVVLNRANKRHRMTSETKDALRELEDRGVAVCTHTMPDRAAIPRASRAQSVVFEVSFGWSARKEMKELFEEINEHGRKATEHGRRSARAAGGRGTDDGRHGGLASSGGPDSRSKSAANG